MPFLHQYLKKTFNILIRKSEILISVSIDDEFFIKKLLQKNILKKNYKIFLMETNIIKHDVFFT